jgi:transcriptional regulator with XRE-family HTH domain
MALGYAYILEVPNQMSGKLTDIRLVLASNIKRFRKEQGFSQEKLAEKSGTAANYIALIETRKRFPTPDMLEKIALALDVDTPQLFSVSEIANAEANAAALEKRRILRGAILADIDRVLEQHLG